MADQDEYIDQFYICLRREMDARGISDNRLSLEIGQDRSFVRKMFLKRIDPKWSVIVSISNALCISAGKLVGDGNLPRVDSLAAKLSGLDANERQRVSAVIEALISH